MEEPTFKYAKSGDVSRAIPKQLPVTPHTIPKSLHRHTANAILDPMDGKQFPISSPGPVLGDAMLLVNFSTSVPGSVCCEILDATGTPVPGFTMDDCDEIYGDRIEWPVSWRSLTELKHLAGKPITLRFELKDADLYAIRFGRLPTDSGPNQ